MACCNKQGCDKNKAALLDTAVITTAAEQGATIISKLLEIVSASGGLMYIFKDNPKLTELAEAIKMLAAENEYLKKKLSETTTPVVAADAADLIFKFGPENEYTLLVPTGSPDNRGKLAGQLITAAADLLGRPAADKHDTVMTHFPDQRVFPFVENTAK
jgi:hypothetical protein